MLSTAVVVVLTLTCTTNLVLSCPPSSEITEVQDIRLCNGSLLSIKFNLSDSCSNILGKVYPYIYQYSLFSGGIERDHVSWGYSHYSDLLCGITARFNTPLIINVNRFNRTNLLQIRLRELFSSGSEICSNNFHVFLDNTGFLGPPVNISFNSYNCSFINVTWSDPDYQCGIKPVYYNLSIYDVITGSLVDTVSVYGTSYQFVDNDLFIHRYTYVITGVNELGEGISNNDTFSYQRVPKLAVEHTTLEISNYTQDMVIVLYHTRVTLECASEAPGNISVIIQCNRTGVVYDNIYLVEYTNQSINVTGLVPVTLNQQCTFSILYNNSAGTSEPYVSVFVVTPPLPSYTSSLIPTVSVIPTSSSTLIITTLLFGVLASLAILIAVALLSLMFYLRRKKMKGGYYGYYQERSRLKSAVPSELVSFVSAVPKRRPSIDMGKNIAMQPMPKDPNNDNHETKVVITETNKEQDHYVPISYDTDSNEQQSSNIENTTTTTGEATTPHTETSSVQCTDTVDKTTSSPTEFQFFNEVLVFTRLTFILRDLSPPEKTKGATTIISQEVNGKTDTSRILPHHVDDPVINEREARTLIDIKIVTDMDEKEKVSTIIKGTETSSVSSLATQTNFDDHKQLQFIESNKLSQSVSLTQSLTLDEEAFLQLAVDESTEISTDSYHDDIPSDILVVPRHSFIPERYQRSILVL